MKRKLLRIFAFAALLTGVLASCTDDIGTAVVESRVRSRGPRLSTALSVVPVEDPTETKSTFTGDPALVTEWTLLQFDTDDGKLVAKYHIASGEDITNIEVVAGHPYHWFAVANCGDVRGNFTLGTTSVTSMSNWVADALDMASAQTKGSLPMSWTSTTANPSGIGFTREQIQQNAVLDVPLKRLVAKYDITINRANLSKYTYNVDNARVVGPTSVKPFATNQASAVVEGADVATTAGTSSDKAKLNGGNAATFYALENMYGEKTIADAWSKKPKNIGENDHPTYVEIMGKATGAGLVDVPVTYRFFLGTNATTNFDVIRNTANTITLVLSDAAIDAAIEEADTYPDPNNPPQDPLWKIESGRYDDSRVLKFQDGLANEGTGLTVNAGVYTAEPIIRNPEDLNYKFKLDAALYSGGVRVFYDNAGANEIPAGYGSDWVTLSGSPATLYFYIPAGSPACTGQAHIITQDGRKYDDMIVNAGRILTKLKIQFGKLTSGSSGQSFNEWNNVYYESAYNPYYSNGTATPTNIKLDRLTCDTIFVQLLQGTKAAQWGAGFAMRVYAVYGDGTEILLNSDFSTEPHYSWSTDKSAQFTNTIGTGVNMGLYNGEKYFYRNFSGTSGNDAKMLMRTLHSGTGLFMLTYSEAGVTKEAYIRTKVHCGILQARPSSTTSSRIDMGLTETKGIQYYWVDNNAKYGDDNLGGIDITDKVAPNITMTAGTDYVRYDGLSGGYANFTGKGVAGEAQSTVGSSGYLNYSDVLTRFGDNPAKGRSAAIPTTTGLGATGSNVSSFGNFDEFRYSYFRTVDDRVLDHLEITPSKVYVMSIAPTNVWYGGTKDQQIKLYAHFTDGSMEDITVSPDVVWHFAPGDYANGQYGGTGYGVTYIHSVLTGSDPTNPSSYSTGYFAVTTGKTSRITDAFVNDGEYKKCTFHRQRLSNNATSVAPYNGWGKVTSTNNPVFFSAEYTFNGVTKTAQCLATESDTREPQSLTISPATQDAYVGGRPVGLTATVTYNDGSTADVTSSATWNNDANSLLTNNGGGSYTTKTTTGSTTVTASYTLNGATVNSNTAIVNVLARSVTGVELQVKPAGASEYSTGNKTVSVGSDQQWRIKVTYADGGDPDYLTTGFNLNSSNTSKLSVNSSTNPIKTHAEATGSSNVTASYHGVNSSNTVTITIEDHSYTYELIVSTQYVHSALTLEAIRADAGSGTIDWDDTEYFYAYYVRYDNGVADDSFGTGETAGKPFRDVTASATWTCGPNLTASNVGTWTFSGGYAHYNANNTSGYTETDDITASYSGSNNSYELTVRKYVAPSLSASPSALEWEWNEYGSSDGQNVTVSASNCTWSVKSISSDFDYSISGNTIKVWPKTQNTSDANKTGTLVIQGTNGVADVTVDLTQYWWQRGKGGIQRQIVEVYIAKKGSTTKITSDEIAASGNETYNLICHSQYRVGSGSWNDSYDVVDGYGLSWTRNTTSYNSLVVTGAYDKADATVTNLNSTSSDQTVRLTATTGGVWSNDNNRIWVPVSFAYTLTHNAYSAYVDITLKPGGPATIYKIVTTVGDSPIAWNGTTTASAKLYSSSDGGSTWTLVRDVTSNVTFTSNKSQVTVSGSTLTANNTNSSAIIATINSSAYTGSETISSYEYTTLTVNGKPDIQVYTYEFVSLELRPGNQTLAANGSVTETLWVNYRWNLNGGSWTSESVQVTSGFSWSWTGDTGYATRSDGTVTNTNTSGSAKSVVITATVSPAKTITAEHGSFSIPNNSSASATIGLTSGVAKTLTSIDIGMGDLFHGDTYHTATSGKPYGVAHYSDGSSKDLTAADFDGYEVKGYMTLGSWDSYAPNASINGHDYPVGEASIRGSYTEGGVTKDAQSNFNIIGWFLNDFRSMSAADGVEVGFGNSAEVGFKAVYQVYPGGTTEERTLWPTQTEGLTGLPSGITYSNSAGVYRFVVESGTATGTYSITCRYTDPENSNNTKSTTFTITVSTTGYTLDTDGVN